MSWLTPLGFLGLLGIIALIIIYIIKPNFQNKIISSTYIWKKSLKYKKKKIPISKLRNLLLFICQILIITTAALILAQPFIPKDDTSDGKDTVVIIDASASMLAETSGYSRFERAVSEVIKYADQVFEDGKRLSVIVASDESYYLVQQASAESGAAVKASLSSLLDESQAPVYTFGTPDIAGAITLAEEITAYTLNTEVLLYTDSHYIDAGHVKVVDVSDTADWNAAILDVRANIVENHYVFEIDVACYGADYDVDVYCDFYGVNFDESTFNFKIPARCSRDEVQTIVFSVDEETATEVFAVYQYDYLHVYLAEYDSLEYDNSFYLYGGKRPILSIQYYSALPNNYFASTLMVLREKLGDYWDIEIDEVKYDEVPETEGYDVYIFEHVMPSKIPTDGIVILANPNELPASTGIQLGKQYSSSGGKELALSAGDSHPIMNNINPELITVTRFTEIANCDGYTPLMYCDAFPLIMVKDEPDAKIVAMTFSLNYSNFALTPFFPLFMYNIVDYFAPQTLSEFVFDINESVELNSRGEVLNVEGPSTSVQFDSFPGTLKLTKTGTYTATQDLISGETLVESFYVKLPAEESNINQQIDKLENPYYYQETSLVDMDLLIYFARALVALLFVEWWLKSREQV